jgi:O-antigen/teichoic acid export membrane protein
MAETLPPDPPQVGPAPRPMTGGAVMSAVSRFGVAGTGALATVVIARLLGPRGSGAYAIAQTLVQLLVVATTLGVEHGIAYYVSSGRWRAADAFRSSQRVAIVSGVAGAAAGVLARLLIPSAFRHLSVADSVITALALPFSLSWFYASYLALATDQYEAYVLPSFTQSSVALVLVAGLAIVDGVGGAIIGYTASQVITAVIFLFAGRRLFHRGAAAGPPEEAGAAGSESSVAPLRRAISFGIKGYATNALQYVNYRLDLFILNATVSTAAVGQYSVAVAVTGVLWLLPQALSDVLFPRVAALSASTAENAAEALAMSESKSLRHTALASLAVTAVLAGVLLVLVVPVYGARFRPAIDLGLILLPGAALLGLAGPLSATILGRGHPRMMLTVTLITTPVTVALYVLLIPTLKASGAALASTISYAGTFVLTALFYTRVTGHNAFARMIPTRSELHDYRMLAPAVLAWVRGRARRG